MLWSAPHEQSQNNHWFFVKVAIYNTYMTWQSSNNITQSSTSKLPPDKSSNELDVKIVDINLAIAYSCIHNPSNRWIAMSFNWVIPIAATKHQNEKSICQQIFAMSSVEEEVIIIGPNNLNEPCTEERDIKVLSDRGKHTRLVSSD